MSVRKLAQLLRVGLAKLPLRGDGTRAAREMGEYLAETETLRAALSEAEMLACRLSPADFDRVLDQPIPAPPATPP
eukprot:6204105-Pleurochrysis_carterae.AAC.1